MGGGGRDQKDGDPGERRIVKQILRGLARKELVQDDQVGPMAKQLEPCLCRRMRSADLGGGTGDPGTEERLADQLDHLRNIVNDEGFHAKKWLARLGLNQRPLPCQGSALPLSYEPTSHAERSDPSYYFRPSRQSTLNPKMAAEFRDEVLLNREETPLVGLPHQEIHNLLNGMNFDRVEWFCWGDAGWLN